MKNLVKSLYSKATTATPLNTDVLSQELMVGISKVRKNLPLPDRFTMVDAQAHSSIVLGSLDITINEDTVAPAGMKGVYKGKVNAKRIHDAKYPTIIAVSNEMRRKGNFEDMLM